MYNIEDITTSYELCTCVTFEDGQKTSFRKVEHIAAKKVKTGFAFTFLGCEEEIMDGGELDDWGKIFMALGKALYPYTLLTNENGKLVGVKDFEKLKEGWIASRDAIIESYDYNYEVKKVAYSYSQTLATEKIFLGLLRRNMFFRLLFWQDDLTSQEVEIMNFPNKSALSIFCFQGWKKEEDGISYETDTVYDEGKFDLLSGNCAVRIRRDADGLPGEVTLLAKVEKRYRGYYIKEIKLRRL